MDGSGHGHLASSSPRNARLSPTTCSKHLLACPALSSLPKFKLYPSGLLGRVFPKPPRKVKQITLGECAPAPPELGAGSATSQLLSLLQAGKRARWSRHRCSHPARNAQGEFKIKTPRYTPAPLQSPAWEGLCQRGSPHSPAPPLAPRDNNGDKTFPAPPGRRRGRAQRQVAAWLLPPAGAWRQVSPYLPHIPAPGSGSHLPRQPAFIAAAAEVRPCPAPPLPRRDAGGRGSGCCLYIESLLPGEKATRCVGLGETRIPLTPRRGPALPAPRASACIAPLLSPPPYCPAVLQGVNLRYTQLVKL